MSNRYVLITGASRGLGRDMAETLAREGFRVLAGVRRMERTGGSEGGAAGGIQPLLLDVTDPSSIRAAATEVDRLTGAAGLAGLVNNAGIASFRPLEQQPMEEFEETFRVNVFGVQAITQALLPAIRRARGRIVNISSGNGKLVMPFTGAYCASKFALEALSDALRMELAPWGIHVAVVEPGAMATDIRVRGVEAWEAEHGRLPAADQALYARALERVATAIRSMEGVAGPLGEVSQAVLRALTDPEPKARYPVGPHMDQLDALAALPDRERDRFAMGVLGL